MRFFFPLSWLMRILKNFRWLVCEHKTRDRNSRRPTVLYYTTYTRLRRAIWLGVFIAICQDQYMDFAIEILTPEFADLVPVLIRSIKSDKKTNSACCPSTSPPALSYRVAAVTPTLDDERTSTRSTAKLPWLRRNKAETQRKKLLLKSAAGYLVQVYFVVL